MQAYIVHQSILSDNKELRQISQEESLRYRMARLVMRLRVEYNITQAELAELTDTKQPAIARIENAKILPSLEFLDKLAKAVGTELIDPNFASLSKKSVEEVTTLENRFSIPHLTSIFSSCMTSSNIKTKEVQYG